MQQSKVESFDEMLAAVPKLAPFSIYPRCPKCAGELGAGIPFLRRWLRAHGTQAQTFVYCSGGSDEKLKVPGLHFGPEGAHPALMDVQSACWGLVQEHLHLQCGRCSFRWLMAVKP